MGTLATTAPSVMNDPMTVHHEDATPVVDLTLDNNHYPKKFNDIEHSLDQDLAREAIIYKFSGDKQTDYLDFNRTDIPRYLMAINPLEALARAQVIRQRLAHYKYLLFDAIKIKVKWNTGINMDGMGILWYDFAPGLDTACENLTCVSGTPSSCIANYSVTNSVELRIPFWLPSDKVNISQLLVFGKNDPSMFSQYNQSVRLLFNHIFPPYLQNQHLHFTVYASFENPRVEGQTLNAVEILTEMAARKDRDESEIFHLQGNLDSEPVQQGRSGIISGVAGHVGAIGNLLSGVPVIGTVASTVSTAANIIGGIAGMFGFGKPLSVETTTKVINRPFRGLGIPVVDDHSENLANQAITNTNPKYSNFITTKDEMDLEYVGRNSAIIDTFYFDMDNEHEDILWQTIIAPRENFNADFGLYNTYTTGQFVLNNFDLCAFETCDLEFEISKTPFHNGVIEVSYMPVTSDTGAGVHTSGGDEIQSVLKTESFSLVNLTRFTFSIPMIYETRWMNASQPFASVLVRVISPLSTNENINPRVRFTVALSYKGLRACNFRPAKFFSTAKYFTTADRSNVLVPFNTQSAPGDEVDEEVYDWQINIGNAEDAVTSTFGEPHRLDEEDVAITTGDVTRNLRPLTRIFSSAPLVPANSVPGAYYMKRHEFLNPYDTFISNNTQALHRYPNIFTMCAMLYWFNRGGFRYKLGSSNRGLGNKNMILAAPDRDTTQAFLPGYYNLDNVARNDLSQVEVPQGTETRFFYTAERDSYLVGKSSVIAHSAQPLEPRYFYAGADDFNFFGLHGVPQCTFVHRKGTTFTSSETLRYFNANSQT